MWPSPRPGDFPVKHRGMTEAHDEWLTRLNVVIGKEAAVRIFPDGRFVVRLSNFSKSPMASLDDIRLDVARLALKGQPFWVRVRMLFDLRRQ